MAPRLVPGDMRAHFTLKGVPKRSYPDRQTATFYCRKQEIPYQCPICKCWHKAPNKDIVK